MHAFLAQSAPASSSDPDARATQFVPVEGGADSVDANGLMVAAYLLMWLAILGLVLMGWLKQRALDGRLQRLEGALDQAERARDGEDSDG